MARGDNISTTVPSVGDAEPGGTTDLLTIVTALVAIAESKVSSSELSLDATVDFNTNAAENLTYLEFITQSSSPGNEMLYTKNDGATDELYFTNGSGQEVQITNGGSLNVAATGSVTGSGYGSGGVEVNWSSVSGAYLMKSGSGADDYADVICDDLLLRDGSSHAITLTAQSMSSDYTLTFPASVTAGLLTTDGSGNLAYETTIPDNLTFTGDCDFSGGTIESPDYSSQYHGDYVMSIPLSLAVPNTGANCTVKAQSITWGNPNGSDYAVIPISLPVGARIKQISIYCLSNTGSTNVPWEFGTQDVTSTTSISTYQSGSAFTTTGEKSIVLTTPLTVAADVGHFLIIDPDSDTSTVQITNIEVTWDKPAP